MPRHQEPDVIPCDPSRVNMGGSYARPPDSWRSHDRDCVRCQATFQITAAEQRFWYEELQIFFFVRIERCPACRRWQRTQRRILTGLAALIPVIDAGSADALQRRDCVLTIAEGMTRRMYPRKGGDRLLTDGGVLERREVDDLETFKEDMPILHGRSIALRAAELIAALRKDSPRHDDLLPIQILVQQRLGNAKKAERLQGEEGFAQQRSAAMARALIRVRDWMKIPTRSRRQDITHPPRK